MADEEEIDGDMINLSDDADFVDDDLDLADDDLIDDGVSLDLDEQEME